MSSTKSMGKRRNSPPAIAVQAQKSAKRQSVFRRRLASFALVAAAAASLSLPQVRSFVADSMETGMPREKAVNCFNRALELADAGDAHGAIEQFQKSLRHDPTFEQGMTGAGDVWKALGMLAQNERERGICYDSSISYYLRAADVAGRKDLYLEIGRLYVAKGDTAKGLSFMQRSVAEAVDPYKAYLSIAKVYSSKNMDSTLHYLGLSQAELPRTVITSSTDAENARFELAKAYYECGKLDESLKLFEESNNMYPTSYKKFMIGMICSKQKKLGLAIEWYDKALMSGYPTEHKDPAGYYNLGTLLAYRGRIKGSRGDLMRAADLYRQAVAMAPERSADFEPLRKAVSAD